MWFGPDRRLPLASESTARRAARACAALLIGVGPLAAGGHAQTPATTIQPVAGFTVERASAAGAVERFALTLVAGQFADLVIEDDSTMMGAYLSDASGTQIARLRPTSIGVKRLWYIAEQSGTYTITLRAPPDVTAPVPYAVRVRDVRLPSDDDRLRARGLTEFLEGERLQIQRSAEGFRGAIARYQASAALWRQTGDRLEEAHAWGRMGNAYHAISEYQHALDAHQHAATLRHELGDRRGEAMTLNNIGGEYYVLGNYPKALESHERALPLGRETNDRDSEADTLSGIGLIYQSMGQTQKGLEFCLQAIDIWRAIGDRNGEARSLADAASAYQALGNSQRALELLDEALRVHRASGNRFQIARTLVQIGVEHMSLGDPDKALVAYEEALPLQQATGDRRGVGYTNMTIGRVLAERGEYSAALERISSSVEILRTLGDRSGEAAALLNAGRAWLWSGDPQRALSLLSQARDLYREIGDRRNAAIVNGRAAQAHASLGQTDLALQEFADALATLRTVRDRGNEVGMIVGLASLERRIGRLDDARRHAGASLDLIESRRAGIDNPDLRASYLSRNDNAYALYIDVEMDLEAREPGRGHGAAALHASERARARGLLELLSDARLDISSGVNPVLKGHERDLTGRIRAADSRLTRLLSIPGKPDEIAAAEREADALVSELREVERQLKIANPRYAALTQPSPLDLPGIQRLLDPDTVLLEYSLGEKRSYVWAITHDALTSAVLADGTRIEDAARRSYGLLSSGARRVTHLQTQRSLEALSDLVLAPVRSALSARRVVIVADGALQYVPFAALPRPHARATAAAAAEPRLPLVARHEVVMLPSASALEALRQVERPRGRTEGTLAVFADPVLHPDDPRVKTGSARSRAQPGAARDAVRRAADEVGAGSLDRLPFTRAEANALTALAGSAHTLEALDFDASREAAIAGHARYRIVHFATHALLNSRHPELSGIILSLVDRDGRPTDGFLRLHDIYNLSLNADLVVLSACRTALGKDIRGEGLVGLTRGFLYAGAPAVVASLWDVRDRSTAELMTRFYRAMLRDHLSPAAALRAAQTSMWRDPRWSAPAHWAGFVLQGDWRSTR